LRLIFVRVTPIFPVTQIEFRDEVDTHSGLRRRGA